MQCKCSIKLVKRYHKPRYNLVIDNAVWIKIPKKKWYLEHLERNS